MNPTLVSTSKFLSLVLRHKPEEIGLSLEADGERVSGVYRRSVILASAAGALALDNEYSGFAVLPAHSIGRFAVLDDGMGFSLVPWRPVIEQRMGQPMSAVVRGSGVSWEFGRQRGPSI